jgi:hypothetical protein
MLEPIESGTDILLWQTPALHPHLPACSATGASEPQNLLFMRRLGSFGFNDMEDMVAMLKK